MYKIHNIENINIGYIGTISIFFDFVKTHFCELYIFNKISINFFLHELPSERHIDNDVLILPIYRAGKIIVLRKILLPRIIR